MRTDARTISEAQKRAQLMTQAPWVMTTGDFFFPLGGGLPMLPSFGSECFKAGYYYGPEHTQKEARTIAKRLLSTGRASSTAHHALSVVHGGVSGTNSVSPRSPYLASYDRECRCVRGEDPIGGESRRSSCHLRRRFSCGYSTVDWRLRVREER